jgi:hypothetical protein
MRVRSKHRASQQQPNGDKSRLRWRSREDSNPVESVVGRNVLPALLAFAPGRAAQYCRIRRRGNSATPTRV